MDASRRERLRGSITRYARSIITRGNRRPAPRAQWRRGPPSNIGCALPTTGDSFARLVLAGAVGMAAWLVFAIDGLIPPPLTIEHMRRTREVVELFTSGSVLPVDYDADGVVPGR